MKKILNKINKKSVIRLNSCNNKRKTRLQFNSIDNFKGLKLLCCSY
jgi:hypothetical protein